MVISTMENKCKEGERLHHVYLQNLPWTACQGDILTFFKDLQVAEGGILIHGSEAFVAFQDSTAATKAMLRSGALLHGVKIEISLVEKKFIPKMLLRNVCRTLKFDDQIIEKKESSFVVRRKKLRPTRINETRPTNFCSFLPDEIDYTGITCGITEKSPSCSSKEDGQSHNKVKKKINPTNLADANKSRFNVFHPEYCYYAKKIRLGNVTESFK